MKFTEMHGAGNDFLVAESAGEERDWPRIAEEICERNLGVGADGLMLILPSERADFRMRLFNADGSEAEVSGNGVRCLVKYAVERMDVTPKDGRVTIEAIHDVLEAEVTVEDGVVRRSRLSMGPPHFEPSDIPVRTAMSAPVLDMKIEVDGELIPVGCVSMGNPHAVLFIETDVDEYPLERADELPAAAGDVVFMNSLTPHGSNLNTTDEPRVLWIIQIRSPEDHPIEQPAGTEQPTAPGNRPAQGTMLVGVNPDFERAASGESSRL